MTNGLAQPIYIGQNAFVSPSGSSSALVGPGGTPAAGVLLVGVIMVRATSITPPSGWDTLAYKVHDTETAAMWIGSLRADGVDSIWNYTTATHDYLGSCTMLFSPTAGQAVAEVEDYDSGNFFLQPPLLEPTELENGRLGFISFFVSGSYGGGSPSNYTLVGNLVRGGEPLASGFVYRKDQWLGSVGGPEAAVNTNFDSYGMAGSFYVEGLTPAPYGHPKSAAAIGSRLPA